jgi:hypothetical protein
MMVALPGVNAAWSLDDDLVAYGSPEGVFLLDVPSGASRLLISEPPSGSIRWSPSGTYLLLSFGDGYRAVPLDSPTESVHLPSGRNFSWSPDGKRISYISEGCTTDDWNVYVTDIEGGTPIAITANPGVVKEGLSWLTNGDTVVYSTGQELIATEVGSKVSRAFASVTSDAAGYLHYHENLQGRALKDGSPDRRHVVFNASVSGHGVCD